MQYGIPFNGSGAYLTLLLITSLGAALPFCFARKRGRLNALKKSALAVALVLPFTLWIGGRLHHNELTIAGNALSVRAAHSYHYTRSLEDFDLGRAQSGAYQSIPDAQLKWRRNGLGLPGMRAGRFTTTQGKLLFALLTDQSSVLYLPARTGPSLLVSLDDPRAVLDELKRRQASPQQRQSNAGAPCTIAVALGR